jgi:transcription elongation factor Elf1
MSIIFGPNIGWEKDPLSDCELCATLMTEPSPFNELYADIISSHNWENTYGLPVCKHVFHTACLLQWETTKNGHASCPLCRVPFRMNAPPRKFPLYYSSLIEAIINKRLFENNHTNLRRLVEPVGTDYVKYTAFINSSKAVEAHFYNDKVEIIVRNDTDVAEVFHYLYDLDRYWAFDRLRILPKDVWQTIYINNKLSDLYPNSGWSE